MTSPQSEQALQQLLADRLAVLEQIKKVQAEIDGMGFVPADAAKQNKLIADRLKLLQQQKQTEADIRRADPALQRGVQFKQDVADRLKAIHEERQLIAEKGRLAAAVRRDDLRARYGAAGDLYARAERFGQSRTGRALGGGVMAFGAFASNAARSGMQGTVEQNRLDYEWKLLNREFAAAFKPITDLYTAGVSKLRRFMEGLDETGQNLVMVGGSIATAVGLFKAAGLARNVVGGLAGLAGGGALAGAGGSALAGGVAGAGGALAGAGGGALAGAGGAGVLARLARFPVKHPVAMAAAAAVITASALTPDSPATSQEFQQRHIDQANELNRMQKAGGTDALMKKYQEIRERRGTYSKVTSWVGARFGYAGQDRDTLEETERRLKAMGVNPEGTGKRDRRSITPDIFGYEEAGSAYRRTHLSYLSKTAADEEAKAANRPLGPFGNPIATPEETQAIFRDMVAKLEEIRKSVENKPEVK